MKSITSLETSTSDIPLESRVLKAFNAHQRTNNPLLFSFFCCFTLIFEHFVSGGWCTAKVKFSDRVEFFSFQQSTLSHLCKQLCINDVHSIPLNPLSQQKRIIHKKRREKIIRFVSPLSHFYSTPKFAGQKRQRKSVCSLSTLSLSLLCKNRPPFRPNDSEFIF